MSKNKRKFGLEEKPPICRVGKNKHGVDATYHKYQIARSLHTAKSASLTARVLIVLPCYRFVGQYKKLFI